MKRSLIAAAFGVIALASSCGGPSAAERLAARQLQAQYLSRGVHAYEQKLSQAHAQEAYAACNSQIGDVVSALNDLDGRLNVGLTYDKYSASLSNASAAYNTIVVKDLSQACLSAGAPAESALNAYIAAHDIWKDCIDDIYCAMSSVRPKMQDKWSVAAREVKQATNRLASIRRPARTVEWATNVPVQAQDVAGSLYGHAVVDLCGPSAPVAAVKPCDDLQTVLDGGVASNELASLDDAVTAINLAYHLAPPQEG
jgi:hypothetical protein